MPPSDFARIPDSFVAGDTVQWTESIANFSSDDWEMEVTFVPADATAGAAIQIASDGASPAITKNSGGGFTGKISSTVSSSFTADTTYHWQKVMRDGTDRYSQPGGRILALSSMNVLKTAGGTHDVRSTVKQTLDQIRARIQGRSLLDQDSMSIGNRAVSRMNMADLIKWEAVFAGRYENELRRERIGRGLKTSRSVKVRFTA